MQLVRGLFRLLTTQSGGKESFLWLDLVGLELSCHNVEIDKIDIKNL